MEELYFDTETGLYYANGSYYDPETGTYLDASPVYTIEKLSTHNLDRNGLMCNNVLELSCNPYTINTVTELYPDPAYEIGERKIQWWHWVIGGAFALGSFILAAVTCGLTIAITATLIGAGVGAAYGAFTAHTARSRRSKRRACRNVKRYNNGQYCRDRYKYYVGCNFSCAVVAIKW